MKYSIKQRIWAIVLTLAMIVPMLPVMGAHVHAAGTLTLSVSDLGANWGANTSNGGEASWNVGTDGKSITGTAKGYKFLGFLSNAITTTLTLTNNKSGEAILSFNYALTGGGSVAADTGTMADGTYTGTLAKGASVTITLTSPKGTTTNTLKITDISLVLNATGDVNTTFHAPVTGGSFKVDGAAISSDTLKTDPIGTAYSLVATAASGYKFIGWYQETGSSGKYFSTADTTTVEVDSDSTIYPVFVSTATPIFQVGTGNYFYDLDDAVNYAAANSQNQVTLISSGTISDANYTIPAGMTLYIPYSTDYTPKGEKPVSTATYTAPSAYVTLTLGANTTITVNGTVEVGSMFRYCSGGNVYGNAPTGKYGAIYMPADSNIVLNNGAILYAWGYIYGNGEVTANSGSKVYEFMQIADFYGGGNLGDMKHMFPFSQYYVQNIETALTLNYGATEYLYLKLVISNYELPAAVEFIGSSSSCMFRMEQGSSVTKDYDPTTDRLILDINGNAALQSVSMEPDLSGFDGVTAAAIRAILSSMLGGTTINSANYILNLNSNMTINVNSGMTTISQEVSALPGVEIYIDYGATLKLASGDSSKTTVSGGSAGKNAYLFDSEQWGNYIFATGGAKQLITAAYSPTTNRYKRTAADLKDVVLDVNGKIITDGFLYTTVNYEYEFDDEGNLISLIIIGGGASIISSEGTGVIDMNNGAGTEGAVYNLDGAGASETTIFVASAQLKNGDDTYLDTTGAEPGTIYAYCSTHDCWYTGECEKCNATFTITWVVNGNTITSTSVRAGDFPEIPEEVQDLLNKEGYTVTWNKDIVKATADETYEAVVAPKKFTVTWVDGNGETIYSDEWDYDTVPVFDPSREGDPTKTATAQYTYAWTGGWDKTIVAVTGDVTYTATFTEITNEYRITWKDTDGNDLYAEDWAYGSLPVFDASKIDENYAKPDCGTASVVSTVNKVTGEATYEVKWTINHTAGTPVQENVVAPSCTANGSYDEVVYCTECGAEISRTNVNVDPLGHDWADPTYTWNGKDCTAERVCKTNAEHKESETVPAIGEVTTDPTCTEKGWTTYTADFASDWAETQTTDAQDVPATDHDWQIDGYTNDGDTHTIHYVCDNDSTHTKSQSDVPHDYNNAEHKCVCEKLEPFTSVIIESGSVGGNPHLTNSNASYGETYTTRVLMGQGVNAWYTDVVKVTVDGVELIKGVDYSYDLLTVTLNINGEKVTGDIEITAKVYAKVTFVLNGGELTDEVEAALAAGGLTVTDGKITMPLAFGVPSNTALNDTFVREGYTCTGLKNGELDADLTAPIDSNCTLTVQWQCLHNSTSYLPNGDKTHNKVCANGCILEENIPCSDRNGDENHDCDVCGAVNVSDHTGGTATCQAAAVCAECGQSYGDKDASNHTGKPNYTTNGDGTHSATHYECCNATFVVTNEEHTYNANNVCTACGAKAFKVIAFTEYNATWNGNYVDIYKNGVKIASLTKGTTGVGKYNEIYVEEYDPTATYAVYWNRVDDGELNWRTTVTFYVGKTRRYYEAAEMDAFVNGQLIYPKCVHDDSVKEHKDNENGTHDVFCNSCNLVVLKSQAHTYDETTHKCACGAVGHVCAENLTHVDAQDATCTETGIVAHYACSCGKFYSDAEATNEISDADTIAPIVADNHDWQIDGYTNDDDATHTINYVCSHNASHTKSESGKSHNYNSGNSAHTCACGKVEVFTIYFHDTGDLAYESITLPYGQDVATLADPTKTGYTFTGWSEQIPETMPGNDVHITAQWQINTYTITWNINDKFFTTTNVEYGAVITVPAYALSEGHTFSGWDVPATMPAEDLTIDATLTVNTYTLTVEIWPYNNTVKLENVPYGANLLEVLAKAAQEGKISAVGSRVDVDDQNYLGEYCLDGYYNADIAKWVDETTTMPADHVTISEQMVIIGWQFCYDNDGNYVGAMYSSEEGHIWETGWHYIVEDYDGVPGGAWYYFAFNEDHDFYFRVEGVTWVPYPSVAINGITYGPRSDDEAENVDTTSSYFVFDENGKFLYTLNGLCDYDLDGDGTTEKHWAVNGQLPMWLGLVQDGDDYYYFWANNEMVTSNHAATNGIIYLSRDSRTNIPENDPFVWKGIYYFGEDGKLLKYDGITNIDGTLYYFDNWRLALKAGLVKVDGNYYYVRSTGKLVVNAKYWIYNVNEFTNITVGTYKFDENGVMDVNSGKNGVYEENGGLFYYVDGKLNYAGLIEYDGGYIYVRSNGQLATGKYWITKHNNNASFPEGFYTFGTDGKMILDGVVNVGGTLYYYENGKPAYKGLMEYNGGYIYVRHTGELVIDRAYWITKTNGLMDAGNCVFDSNGMMVLEDGKLPETKNGVVAENGGLFYYVDGKLNYAGLMAYNGGYIYVRSNGQLVTDRKYWTTKTNGLMDADNYTFDANGMMITE